MVVKAVVDGSAVRDAVAELKKIDPALHRALTSELRSSMAGAASQIKSAWPNVAPLSGMRHNGRTGYTPPGTGFSFTPGRPRRGGISSLMAIKIKIPKNQVGSWIGEMAGLRGDYGSDWSKEYNKNGQRMQHRVRGQGRYMVHVLSARYGSSANGGRWGWKKFMGVKTNLRQVGMGILEKHVDQMNRSR